MSTLAADETPRRPRVAVVTVGDGNDRDDEGGRSRADPFGSVWLAAAYELTAVDLAGGRSSSTLRGRVALGMRLARALRRARPQVLHLRCRPNAPVEAPATCLAVAGVLRIPVVVEVAGEPFVNAFDRTPAAVQARIRRRFQRADVCLASNDALATALHQRLRRAIDVVDTTDAP